MSAHAKPSWSRRSLIHAAGGGALAAPLLAAGAAAAQDADARPPARPVGRPFPKLGDELPRAPGEQVGWAVLGLGEFAVNQVLPALGRSQSSNLVGLVSGDGAKAQRLGRAYGLNPKDLYTYDTFDRIADNPDIQVVYVVTPNSLHRPFVERAFKAGKHVLCEKPFATTSADCQAMIAAAKRADRKLMVAYRAHFEPHNIEARRMAQAGELGRLRFYDSDHGRTLKPENPADQWRAVKALAGGGSLFDIGIYGVNGAMMLLGEEQPTEVTYARINNPPGDPRFAEVEDTIAFGLSFPSGVLAQFSSSYTYNTKRIGLAGDKALVRLDPATDYAENTLTLSDTGGSRQVKVEGTEADQFTGELDHMSEAVRDGTPIQTPGEMGLRDVRIIEAVYEAARTGRSVKL